MNIQGITSKFTPVNSQYSNSNAKRNINFKGAIGDKFVQEMVSGSEVEIPKMLKAVKGAFGLKSEKVSDVFESLTQKIGSLISENRDQKALINSQADKIAEFPKETKNAVFKAVESVRSSMQETLKAKELEIAEKNKEIMQLQKYKGMANVKSVKEVDCLMPDQIIKLFGEMRNKNEVSLDSMHNFLLNGNGQEEALAQIERNSQIMSARMDGMFNISELKKAEEEMNKNGFWIQGNVEFAQSMISKALEGSNEGKYLESKTMYAQIKKNAKALLCSLVDEKSEWQYSDKDIDCYLDKLFNNIKKFHRNFAKGQEHFTKGGYISEAIHTVKYDNVHSTITYKDKNGEKRIFSFYQIANIGEACGR